MLPKNRKHKVFICKPILSRLLDVQYVWLGLVYTGASNDSIVHQLSMCWQLHWTFLDLQIFNNSLAYFFTGLQWDNLPTGSVVTSQYPEEPPPPGVTEECPGISLHIQQVCFLLFVSVTLLINMSHCHCCIQFRF